MLRILLVRPGATDYDRQGRIQGTLDIPMNEEGERQIESMRGELSSEAPEAIYAAPCQSAEQTAEVLGRIWDLRPRTIEKLHNLDHGLWQGMLVDDVKEKQPRVYRQWQEQPETVCPPRGETVTAAKARAAEALRKLVKKHKNGVIALVVPEPIGSVVRHIIRQDELSDFWKASDGCGHWEMIEAPPTVTGGA